MLYIETMGHFEELLSKIWSFEGLTIYGKTESWILEKERVDRIVGYEYLAKSHMTYSINFDNAIARYIQLKVPSYCQNKDMIKNVEVKVSEPINKNCTLDIISVQRFCPDDEMHNLVYRNIIKETKFGIKFESDCSTIDVFHAIKVTNNASLGEVEEILTWYSTGDNSNLLLNSTALHYATLSGGAPPSILNYVSLFETGSHPNASCPPGIGLP